MCSTHRLHQQLYGDPLAGRFSPKTHPDVCSVDSDQYLVGPDLGAAGRTGRGASTSRT